MVSGIRVDGCYGFVVGFSLSSSLNVASNAEYGWAPTSRMPPVTPAGPLRPITKDGVPVTPAAVPSARSFCISARNFVLSAMHVLKAVASSRKTGAVTAAGLAAAARHEFSFLVRATTAGTFGAAGARVEAMYAPELEGRSQAATVTVR